MGKLKITDKDRGWKKIVADLTALKNAPYVKVGLVGPDAGATHKDQGKGESLSVAAIGMIHEFGSESRNIPERSFIRGTIDANVAHIRSVITTLSKNVMLQKMNATQALGILGLDVTKLIKNRITVERIPPPLKPETIKQKTRDGKAGDTPLVDTGQMLNSVRHQVVIDGKGDE